MLIKSHATPTPHLEELMGWKKSKVSRRMLLSRSQGMVSRAEGTPQMGPVAGEGKLNVGSLLSAGSMCG